MIKKIFSSQLRINMASGVVVTAINTVAMMAAYPIYLHFLGCEKYGVWLVLTTVLSFAQLGNLGIGQAVMKLVAEEHGRGDIEGVQRYVTTALALLCLSGSLILIAILVFKTHIIAVFKLSDENAQTAFWLLPYIGILSIYVFIVQALNATLSGLGRMDLANYIQAASKVIAVAVAAVLLYLGRGLESMIISSAISYLFIQVASMICVRKMFSIRILHLSSLNAKYGQRLLSFGGAVLGSSLISMFLSPFNKLILSRYAGVSTVPIYEIAYTGSMQVRGLVEAGFRALMPEISKIGVNMTIQAKNKMSSLNRRAMKILFFLGIPMYGALIIFSPLLLRAWLGDGFAQNLTGAFRIMLVGTFFSLMCAPAYYTLMGIGKVHYCLFAHIIQGVINAGAVSLVVFFTGTISVLTISLVIAAAMGTTSTYVLIRKYLTMRTVVYSENI